MTNGDRLRIALVAPVAQSVPPPRSGSMESVTGLLADGLVARGHEVTLFATGSSTTQSRTRAKCLEATRPPCSAELEHRGAVGEIVDPGVTGEVFDSQEAMVTGLAGVLSLDRARVRARAEARFGVVRLVDENLAVYNRLAARRPG